MKVTAQDVLKEIAICKGDKRRAARNLSISLRTLYNRLGQPKNKKDNSWRETRTNTLWRIESKNPELKTPEDVIRHSKVDTDIWELNKTQIGNANSYIKLEFKRKIPIQKEQAVNALLKQLENKSVKVKKIRRPKFKQHRRSLEFCVMDPHYGMTSTTPTSDTEQTPALCREMVMDSLSVLTELSKSFGPFDEVFLPLGNDFFHTDTPNGTTTKGTFQPETGNLLDFFPGGEALAIEMIDQLKQIASVKVYMIRGNHDNLLTYMLGRILQAYYHNDDNVTIDATSSPYKFHSFGNNLIGYEHGHNVPAIRMAALMANECPEGWLKSKHGYREWHLGDQHRKGSARPSAFEEQGVSVEFLPGLTAPNQWHREKSFNWQKRGSMAFVWDETRGPISRLQVNIDRHKSRLMGL